MKVERTQDILANATEQTSDTAEHAGSSAKPNKLPHQEQSRLDHESKLVWTRDNPDRLSGTTKKAPEQLPGQLIGAKIEAEPSNTEPKKAKVIKPPKPMPVQHSRPNNIGLREDSHHQTNSREQPVQKVDYSRFFWAEPDIEPKADVNSHNILPQAAPKSHQPAETNRANQAHENVGHTDAPEAQPPAPESPAEMAKFPEAPAGNYGAERSSELDADQLVDLAKSIKIGETDLYSIFEAHQIDAEGLHNVVQEYLRGGNVREALTNEMIQTQLKYEKDPHLKRLIGDTGVKRITAKAGHVASTVKAKTTKKVNKQSVKHHAKRASGTSKRTFDFYRDMYEDYPLLFQVMAVILGVVLYFVLLLVIIKA